MNSLVFSNMLHRPARTVVSLIGIGIGILLIVFTVGLANGNLRERAQREANVGAEIMFRPSGSIGLSSTDALRMPEAMGRDIEKVDGVAAAIPVATNTVASNEGLTGSRLVDGVHFQKYGEVAGLQVVKGRIFTEGKDEVMTDSAWLERRKANIGDKFKLYDRDFEIVGAYEPSAGARIKIPLSTMQAQLGSDSKVSGFLIKVKDGQDPHVVGDRLNKQFPDTQIILTSELEDIYMQGVPALNVFLNVVVGVAGGVSALIILLTMYTTVTERTRQIGVLKSLGMSNAGIAWNIVQEALMISIGGVLIGLVGTIVLSYVLARYTTLIVAIDPKIVLLILGIGIVSGIAGALYPGLKAARLDAVEALNYE
ncbi:MAG: ABC transporter permease [Pyrinomonadaceae bacterium]